MSERCCSICNSSKDVYRRLYSQPQRDCIRCSTHLLDSSDFHQQPKKAEE